MSTTSSSRKLTVALVFGGKSAEHEISLRSARNVYDAIDKTKFNAVLIGIDKSGQWLSSQTSQALLSAPTKTSLESADSTEHVALVPQGQAGFLSLSDPTKTQPIDVVFPILHGPFGEDGTVQGLFKLANVPYVGAGVLGSAVGMDKDFMKRLLRDAGIPVAKFVVLHDYETLTFEQAQEQLGLPMFIKPANLGSSVGVTKVTDKQTYDEAINLAFKCDRKILIEEAVVGREVECSVLGNDHPEASVPGELIINSEFYSYEAKYLDPNAASLQIPAKISAAAQARIQELAVKTFQVLGCEGLGRVDFFLKENDDVLVNEINTMPGFTSSSMYPKMWEASGLSYTDLITRLIELAVERHEKEQRLFTSLTQIQG